MRLNSGRVRVQQDGQDATQQQRGICRNHHSFANGFRSVEKAVENPENPLGILGIKIIQL
jgi:hypothetical protein